MGCKKFYKEDSLEDIEKMGKRLKQQKVKQHLKDNFTLLQMAKILLANNKVTAWMFHKEN
jgi:hypothetical protein